MAQVGGPDVGGEAVFRVVGHADGLLLRFIGHKGQHGAEDLLPEHPHLRHHPGKNGGQEIESGCFVRRPGSAARHTGPLLYRVLHQLLHSGNRRLVNKGTGVGLLIQRAALGPGGNFRAHRQKFPVHAPVNEGPLGRHAGLARAAHFVPDHMGRGGAQVCGGSHNDRGVSP